MHTLEYTEKHEKQNQTSCQDKGAFTDSSETKSNCWILLPKCFIREKQNKKTKNYLCAQTTFFLGGYFDIFKQISKNLQAWNSDKKEAQSGDMNIAFSNISVYIKIYSLSSCQQSWILK